jgi:hypothetical protein
MASASEAKVGALFVNGQTAEVLCTTLQEMGHPQPPTPMQTDNSTAFGIVNSSIRQRRSRAMDMRFYWVWDRVLQGRFLVYWKPGKENLGDYHTKHHPPSHHQSMRSTYLQVAQQAMHSAPNQSSRSVRGCVDSYLPHTKQAPSRLITQEPAQHLMRIEYPARQSTKSAAFYCAWHA